MSFCSYARPMLLACSLLVACSAAAWDRGHVERFATLPEGAAAPEGIAVDGGGNVYVGGFGAGTIPENLFVFGPHGQLLRKLVVRVNNESVGNGLLGLAFHPTSGKLLAADFGHQRVLAVNPVTGAATVFATIPGGVAAGANAIGFDRSGNVYISDSFQGIIWKTGPDGADNGGPATQWVESPLLRTTGVPPFGANGLDFNSAGHLFVANTGNDTIVRIPVTNGNPGTPQVFTNSINGADGLFIDADDNVWVCANQADEVVVVDRTGKAIAKLGDFEGVRRGSPVGLLFPASLARDGNWIYVTNLSLDLRAFSPDFQTVDSQWAAKVTRHTVSRLRARIPRTESD